MIITRAFYSIMFLLGLIPLAAQPYNGNWNSHLSYSNVFTITDMDTKVAASSNAGIFFIDKKARSIQTLSKINGLSDAGISASAYHKASNTLIVGYQNGNIDFIHNLSIQNISDIKRSNVTANKTINDFEIADNLIYTATAFGIVVLNPETFEVKETYILGENSTQVSVIDIEIAGDTIFAVTPDKIYFAILHSSNLVDYTAWQVLDINRAAGNYFQKIFKYDSQIMVVIQNQLNTQTEIWKQSGYGFTLFMQLNFSRVSVFSSEEFLIVSEIKGIHFYNNSAVEQRFIENYPNFWSNSINACMLDKNNQLWVADENYGVYTEYTPGTFTNFNPNGPKSNRVGKMQSVGGTVLCTAGSKTLSGANKWYVAELNIYKNNKWNWYGNETALDYYSIATQRGNDQEFYIGAWWKGVYKYSNGINIENYTFQNSPLRSHLPDNNYIHVSGLVLDNHGNLFTANPSEIPIHVKTPDNNWISYDYTNVVGNMATGDLINTQLGFKWLVLSNGNGFFVFDDNQSPVNTSDDRFVRLQPVNEEDNMQIGTEIYCVTEDNEGNIWFGTDEGIGVYYYPSSIFDQYVFAQRVKITQQVDDSLETQYLLATESITSIKTDGGNRKWIGTRNSGVYLISADGAQEIAHFTTSNSPLISNFIIDIAINHTTGEVFFGTDLGIVSYFSDATVANNTFENVLVYPNPVKNNYQGLIYIKGLTDNSDVRITDINGQLVYKTTSEGGMVTWNGKMSNGQRPATGVYLVFCASPDGLQSTVAKFVFIK